MNELTEWQLQAIPFAAEKAGEWIEECATSNMPSHWSEDEWLCFIEAVCVAYEEKISELRNGREPPF